MRETSNHPQRVQIFLLQSWVEIRHLEKISLIVDLFLENISKTPILIT